MESWYKIEAVRRMQDFIEEHIHEVITMKMLAHAARYSPWHSARIFRELTGKTPFDYIRSLRLSRAAIELKDGDIKIIDVALNFVFDSHEGFTRAFSKQFGIAPKKYSKEIPPVKLFMPDRASAYYKKKQKGENDMTEKSTLKTVFIQVIERPARKMILRRGVKASHYFEYCEEVGCDVWDILSGIKEVIYEPIGMWLPANMQKPGTSEYAQGVELPADYSRAVPENFELIALPPCKMMIFQGPPFEDEKFESAISDIWEVMKNYDPQLYGYEWADEEGPRFQLVPMGYRGYIEGRPVRGSF